MAFDFGNILDPGGLVKKTFNPADPSKDAMGYLDQIPDVLKQYLMPYIQMGAKNTRGLNTEYGNLVNNPGQVLNQIGSGYKQSPGYQHMLQEGTTAAGNAAAAGGMVGSPQHQEQSANIAENIANKDYGDYLTNSLNLFNTGLSGKSHLGDQGFDADKELSSSLAKILGGKAQLGYEGAASQNQAFGSNMDNMIKLLTTLFAG